MSDNPDDFQESPFDAGSFSEWLESTVRSTDKSREEILQQLIASYWTMTELTMEDTTPPFEEPRSKSGDDLSSLDEDRPDNTDPDEVFAQLDTLHTRMGELQERVEELREQVEEVRAESSGGGESIEELRRIVDTHAKRIGDLEDGLEEIDETATQSLALYESLSRAQKSIRNEHGELKEDHNALRQNVDDEFANLRTILEYLFETTEESEVSIRELGERHRELVEERERLIGLKNLALRLGVENAACEYCGTDIDLGTLATPVCPQCAHTFSDIERESQWFGLVESARLTTVEEPSTDRTASSRPDTGMMDTDASVAESNDDGFMWRGDRNERGAERVGEP